MQINFSKRPIIAVVYLAPSLGYNNHPGLNQLIDQASEDIEVCLKCGVDAVLLENEHDRPYTVLAEPEVIASMTITSHEVFKKYGNKIPLGTEFLINDPKASLAIAKASGHSFIRTDYFVDKMSREEYGGEMFIDPEGLISYRNKIKANDIKVLTDIQVKYATMLEKKTILESATEAISKNSDGIIVSSHQTGVAPDLRDLTTLKEAMLSKPVIIGSGLAHENLSQIYPLCDGAVVGSALMTNTRMNYEKVASFMEKVQALRG